MPIEETIEILKILVSDGNILSYLLCLFQSCITSINQDHSVHEKRIDQVIKESYLKKAPGRDFALTAKVL